MDATSTFYFSLSSCSFASVDGKYKFSCVHVICQSFLLRFYYVLGLWSYWDFPPRNFFSLGKICGIYHGFDWPLCRPKFWLHFSWNFLEPTKEERIHETFVQYESTSEDTWRGLRKTRKGALPTPLSKKATWPNLPSIRHNVFVNICKKLSIVVSKLISRVCLLVEKYFHSTTASQIFQQ